MTSSSSFFDSKALFDLPLVNLLLQGLPYDVSPLFLLLLLFIVIVLFLADTS